MSTSPDGIYERGLIDPGVPVDNSTKPFWLTEPVKFGKLQSPWVDSADIVIIGSGMTASSLCRALYSRGAPKIVLLEARDLCSGATGRNGGHMKAMSPGAWHDRKKMYGLQEAIKIMEYEHSHVDIMTACVREENIDCDLDLLEGLDAYYDKKVFDNACKAVEEMREYAPALGKRYTIYTSREDLRSRNVSDECIGAIGMRAGSMWPYKMVTALLEKMIKDNHLSVQTNTVVTSISDNDDDDYATVHTSRGDIKAGKVIHATNGWIGHLVPELRPFVSPVRANVQRRLPKNKKMKPGNSWWLRYGEKDYDFLMQRPDGAYIIGRSNTSRRATADDSAIDFLPHAHLRGTSPLVFDFGGGVETTHAWSGPVGFTLDGNPFIGKLPYPGRSHQWVCAAFQGIGMVRAFRAAHMLAQLLHGEELPEEYPRSMLITHSRVQRLAAVVAQAEFAQAQASSAGYFSKL
ncbi:hypothetical protein CEP51_004603 [Fusarium floridanum]|uniref:FAD dependent oxidoreductase domain-containing protein n=1 Tax=Fusarium floridanum TaxID=1325733 RepID=A0A428S098_9HYPO|nr:hypothetical protein CEP51_004603 [Fusarium floridanum]